MFDHRFEALAGLKADAEALLRRGHFPGAVGTDSTESVTVSLSEYGRVTRLAVANRWRSHLRGEHLGGAVVEAVRNASIRRLTAWGEAFGDPGPMSSTGDLRREQIAIASGPPADADREAALVALLNAVESIERGLDEISGRLPRTLATIQVGHSPHREVTVELTGGGDVRTVRFNRIWLADARDTDLTQQLNAAFRAAYEQITAHGVEQLIARSPLGDAGRALQDPFGLTRRGRAA